MLTLVVLTALAACTQSPSTPPQAGVQNAVPAIEQGILNPGGSFTSSAGVTIRAPAGVLNAPVEVFARAITSSTFPLPLPGDWEPVGNPYLIGATTETFSKSRDSFQIELPVPSGVNSRGLSIATVIPSERSLPQEGTPVPTYWTASFPESVSNLLTLKMSDDVLTQRGFIYILVRRTRLQPSQTGSPRVTTQAIPNFFARCLEGFTCLESVKTQVISSVQNAYNDFVGTMNLSVNEEPLLVAEIRLALTGTEGCVTFPLFKAFYRTRIKDITVCVNSNGQPVNSAYLTTLRHEVFHSVQAGILRSVGVVLDADWARNNRLWIVEGTADTGAVSLSQMNVRPDLNNNLARRVTPSLLDGNGNLPYETQDYWAYVGRRLGLGLIYLKSIFKTGLGDPVVNVDSALTAAGYSGGLFQSYWDWVKNQTVERSVNLRGTPASCRMDLATVGTEYTNFPIVFNFASSALVPVTRTVNVLPLGGRAVKVQFPGASGGVVRVRITPTSAIRYKVYKLVSGQAAGCAALADGAPRGEIVAEIASGTELAIVAANPSAVTPVDVTINIEPIRYWMVMTWGETPTDLDSHFTGPGTAGSRFHTFYAAPFYSDANITAALDVDDVTSFGPETTTTYFNNVTGTYRFSVHDYTNRNAATSTALGSSGARVKVFSGTTSALLNEFGVPGGGGTLWTVFEIRNDVITSINTMGYTADPASVQRVNPNNSDRLLLQNLPAK